MEWLWTVQAISLPTESQGFVICELRGSSNQALQPFFQILGTPHSWAVLKLSSQQGPRTTSSTWALVGNENSQAPPQT